MLYPPQVEWKVYWFHLVSLSVCLSIHPSVDRIVSTLYLHNTGQIYFISTHLINQLKKVCLMVSLFIYLFFYSKIWTFGNSFKFVTLTLSCVHVMWMWKLIPYLEFLLQPLWIFHDDTSRWLTKHKVLVWLKLLFSIFGLFIFHLCLFTLCLW